MTEQPPYPTEEIQKVKEILTSIYDKLTEAGHPDGIKWVSQRIKSIVSSLEWSHLLEAKENASRLCGEIQLRFHEDPKVSIPHDPHTGLDIGQKGDLEVFLGPS